MVGFRETRALLMPFGPVEGVAPGAEIRIAPEAARVRPTLAWLGRVIDAFGEPIDGKGPLPQGPAAYPLRAPPPPAHARGRVGERLDLGVRAMNVFTTCCRGQRLGVFAGSGVGKSVLLSMLAREADCDAVVVGLIGERGREVREFIEETLGEEGLKRAIVVVATSDEPALKRRQAAYMTMAIAEYLRDQDLEVLCLMDSRHPLRHGPARDRPGRRRAADHQGLYPHRLHRTAQAAGARRPRPDPPGRHHGGRRSPACSPCWWTATTTTSRSPTPCAASWTATSSWSAPSPSAAASRRSTC